MYSYDMTCVRFSAITFSRKLFSLRKLFSEFTICELKRAHGFIKVSGISEI